MPARQGNKHELQAGVMQRSPARIRPMTTSRKGWSEEERAYLAAIIESEGGGLVDYRDQVSPSGPGIHSREIEPQERT